MVDQNHLFYNMLARMNLLKLKSELSLFDTYFFTIVHFSTYTTVWMIVISAADGEVWFPSCRPLTPHFCDDWSSFILVPHLMSQFSLVQSPTPPLWYRTRSYLDRRYPNSAGSKEVKKNLLYLCLCFAVIQDDIKISQVSVGHVKWGTVRVVRL